MSISPGALRFNTDSQKLELYDGNQWTEIVASSPDSQTGGARGVFGGGYSPVAPTNTSVIGYINISSTGNAISFGSLSQARLALGGLASGTRGVFGGGLTTPANQTKIDYITISSTGSAITFGDLTQARHWVQTGSNSTRGLFAGGDAGSAVNTIDYIVIFII